MPEDQEKNLEQLQKKLEESLLRQVKLQKAREDGEKVHNIRIYQANALVKRYQKEYEIAANEQAKANALKSAAEKRKAKIDKLVEEKAKEDLFATTEQIKQKEQLTLSISGLEKSIKVEETRKKEADKEWSEHKNIGQRLKVLAFGSLKQKLDESKIGKAIAFGKLLFGQKSKKTEQELLDAKKEQVASIEEAITTNEEEGILAKKEPVKAESIVKGPVKAGQLAKEPAKADAFTAKKDEDLLQQKKQTKNLESMSKDMKAIKNKETLGSFLAKAALLIGAGGLLGFLMTGKTEFLFSMFKGFTKAAFIMKSGLNLVFKPFKLLKTVVGGIGKGIKAILSPIKTIKNIKQLKGLKNISQAFRILKTTFKSIGKTIKGIKGGFGLLKGIGKVAKTAGKGIFKAGGKAGLKKIPFIGSLIGLVFGISRFKKGDILGGILEIASGLTSIIPGIGIPIGIAIDALLLFRDFKGMGGGKPTEEMKKGPSIMSSIFGGVKKVISAIGSVMKFIAKWSLPGLLFRAFKAFDIDKIKGVVSGFVDKLKSVNPFKPIKEFFVGLIGGLTDMVQNLVMKAAAHPVLGLIVRPALGITTEDITAHKEQQAKKDKEKVAKAKEIVEAKQPTFKDTLELKSGTQVRIIPAAQHGAIVTGPRTMLVGEGGQPEAIIPLSKIDDVYREFTNKGIDVTGTARATEPGQIREMREGADRTEEHMTDLKSYLSQDFIPELAKQIAGLINNGTNKSFDVPVSPY